MMNNIIKNYCFFTEDEIYENAIYVKIDDEEFYDYQNVKEIALDLTRLGVEDESIFVGLPIYFNTGYSSKGLLFVVDSINERFGSVFHNLVRKA